MTTIENVCMACWCPIARDDDGVLYCEECGPLEEAYHEAMLRALKTAYDPAQMTEHLTHALEHADYLLAHGGPDLLADDMQMMEDIIRSATQRQRECSRRHWRQKQAREEKWARKRAATAPEASRPLPPQVMDTFDPPITEEVPQ